MKLINIQYPGKISFGVGAINHFTDDLISSGSRRLYILSIEPVIAMINSQINRLRTKGVSVEINTKIFAEPTFNDFHNILSNVREFKPDCIAGIGGGSVMDLAKLIAVFNKFNKPLRDYVGINLLTERRTTLICVPTTSGTGSEVSPNSILLDEEQNSKVGIISPYLIPDSAYIDPGLTLGLPKNITASTGIDALTHCIEAYVNKNAHPVVDLYALEGVRLISKSLLEACENEDNTEARTDLSLGSLYGGMCLGPVNTAAVHALAYPLGSIYHVAHGLSNAILLPHVLRFNLDSAIDKYAVVARVVGAGNNLSGIQLAEDGIDKIQSLISRCGIPTQLRDLNINESDLNTMADSAIKVQRLLKNNVREVTLKDAVSIYEGAY